jgi:hypothetical protein
MKADKKNPAWMYDRRVRERLLASGALDPKGIEKYLAELPDMESHMDRILVEQPALGGGDLDDDE